MRDSVTNPHFTGIIPVVADQSDWNFFNSIPPRGWGVYPAGVLREQSIAPYPKIGAAAPRFTDGASAGRAEAICLRVGLRERFKPRALRRAHPVNQRLTITD